MQTFEIPVANLTLKLIMIPACLLIAGVVLWWAIPAFVKFLRTVTGREPRNPVQSRFISYLVS